MNQPNTHLRAQCKSVYVCTPQIVPILRVVKYHKLGCNLYTVSEKKCASVIL